MWQQRQIGRTDLRVSALGLGTATMGGSRIKITQAEGEALVRAAWEAGVRYIDTAPLYGLGAAERRVGDALRAQPRDEWVLSTKVGRLLRPHQRPWSDAVIAPDGRGMPLPFDPVYD